MCPAFGDAPAVGKKAAGTGLGPPERPLKNQPGGSSGGFPPLSRIFGEKKFPSLPVFVKADPTRRRRQGREGFRDGFVPGWDALRGLSRLEFDPEKSRGERGGFIPKNTTTLPPTPRGMENPISPSTLPNLPRARPPPARSLPVGNIPS